MLEFSEPQEFQDLLSRTQDGLQQLGTKTASTGNFAAAMRVLEIINCLLQQTDAPEEDQREELHFVSQEYDTHDQIVAEVDTSKPKYRRLSAIKSFLPSIDRVTPFEPLDMIDRLIDHFQKVQSNNLMRSYFGEKIVKIEDDEEPQVLGRDLHMGLKKLAFVVSLTVGTEEVSLINDIMRKGNNFDNTQMEDYKKKSVLACTSTEGERSLLIKIKHMSPNRPVSELRIKSSLITFDYALKFDSEQKLIRETACNNLFVANFREKGQPHKYNFFAFFLKRKRIQVLNISAIKKEASTQNNSLIAADGYFKDQSFIDLEAFKNKPLLESYKFKETGKTFENFAIEAYHLSKSSNSSNWILILVRKNKSLQQLCIFTFDDNQSIDDTDKVIRLKNSLTINHFMTQEVVNFITQCHGLVVFSTYNSGSSSICIMFNECMNMARTTHSRTTPSNPALPINRIDVADIHGIVVLAVQDYDLVLTYYYFINGAIHRADDPTLS